MPRRKKRKYTRRKHLPEGNNALPTLEQIAEAADLKTQVRALVMEAPTVVRRYAIADLIADLQWMAQVQEDNAPAP